MSASADLALEYNKISRMDFVDKAYDISLLTIKEVFVYKVPPLRSASGHRAEDWNLAAPLFTGCTYSSIHLLTDSLSHTRTHRIYSYHSEQ